MKFTVLNRKTHKWSSILTSIPLIIMIITGIMLQLKKEISWIQPPTIKGEQKLILIGFDKIFEAAKSVPQTNISKWKDIKRLDVRPSKGMIKVQTKNSPWEIQIDASNGKILQVAKRRSDLIESIHDGSYFLYGKGKIWLFLPAAIICTFLWFTGSYLFLMSYVSKKKKKRSNALKKKAANNRINGPKKHGVFFEVCRPPVQVFR